MRNPKRKVEELELASTATSVRKRPRRSVQKRLKDTEREGNSTGPVEFVERKLTGEAIRRNIELIWDRLTKNHGCKLGIYGMGGVGKTTIMMHIHNRLLRDSAFDGVVFITVSQNFSIHKLQSDIGKTLGIRDMEDEDQMKRAATLSQRLERKKNCVLILDDVGRFLDLKEVGIPVEADGFKLVLTTRSLVVCRQMQCQEMIKIEPLSREEAKSLFLEKLGSKVPLSLEIKAIVKSIVKECAGLPIGVITMAGSIRGVTDLSKWRVALERLKESSMGQTDMEKKVLMILKVSYDGLDNHYVQQCFLSCALYPEDELINKSELVEFFIDQGLFDGLNKREEQYNRGLTILNKLRNVCLLEDHWDRMKMHDLIRDMALHIMGATSMVKAGKRLKRIPPEECWTDTLEKVSLMNNNFREFPSNVSPNCPKLSTLLLNGGWYVAIPDSFFKNLLGLKVLNLSGSYMTELPNSISDLVNLRALILRKCTELRRIPYLGKLTSLRKLDISGCYVLEEVPEGLEILVNLRYLDLPRLSTCELPEGVWGGLLNLQHLKVDFQDGLDMTKLRSLETLKCFCNNVNDFNECVRVINQSNPCPYYYYLCMDQENIICEEESYSTQFEKPERKVDILQWDHAIVSVKGECTGNDNCILIPRDVKTMTMRYCDGKTNLSGMGLLEYPEKLEIKRCENLGVLCGGQIDIPAPTPTIHLLSLRVLKIWECPKLKFLFGHGFKSNLPHLREIIIGWCEEMVGIIAAVTSPPPHPLPFFPSLEQIIVWNCGKMKRAVESGWMRHFPTLRHIKVSDCEKMEEIIGGPPPYLPVEEISLGSLQVECCNNVRKLFLHEWLLHLRNLRSIYVYWCEGMVEMISGAGQSQEGNITTPVNNTPSSFQLSSISLPKLECLDLLYLPQLKSICEVTISCNSMKELTVFKCPKLKRIPLQLRLCEKELPHIWVEDEEKWKTLMWDHPDAQAILQPYLQNGKHVNRESPLFWKGCRSRNAIELDTKGKSLL